MFNSTPLSTPPTPITGHKVHFHLNTADEDESLVNSAAINNLTSEPSCTIQANTLNRTDNVTLTTAPRSIVKNNTNHASQEPPQNHELLLQWESYWDTLEYNCLGRINIDF